MKNIRLLGLCLLVLFSARCACAQTETATITGRVTDSTKAVIVGARVVVTNTETGVRYESEANGTGSFVIPALPPGSYRIEVGKTGFKTIVETGTVLHVQDTLELNFEMAIGSVAESVTVNGSGININTTDAAVSTVIDRQFVANMPLNGRSLQDLMALVPGATLVGNAGNGGFGGTGYAGEFTVNGQRTEANSFSVDGVSANVGPPSGTAVFGGAGFGGGTPAETALGTTQSMISVDALQEFRATTSTYSAEYGRTPGGQFSFTTRSGTNDWHGSAFDYFRNEALDANNWFSNAGGLPKERERQNDFGGTLGGPIFIPHLYDGKNKTFFFFSYEGLRLLTPQGVITYSVPDQGLRQQAPMALQPVLNAFPLPNKGEDGLNDGLGFSQQSASSPSSIDSISVRVDHNFSDKFKIFGRYASAPSVSSSYGSNQVGQTNTTSNYRLVTLGATNFITSSQSNELRFNVTQANAGITQISTDLGGATPFGITTLSGPNGTNGLSDFVFRLDYGGSPFLQLQSGTNSQRQYNVADTYGWTVRRHSLKFGVDWRRLATYSSPLAEESSGFRSESAVLANNVGPTGFIIGQSIGAVEPLYRNFSAFAQDEWKATPRLSLSLGLRWDVNPAPTNLTGPSPYTLNQITNLNTAELAPAGSPAWKTYWRGFAPRLGAAYQLRQTPRRETVLRAGIGMFYDLGNNQYMDAFDAIGFKSSLRFTNVSFPLTSSQMMLPALSIAPPYNETVVGFDPNLKLPYTLQWNVAMEQALGSKQALTLSYVGSAGRRLLEFYYVSPPDNPNLGPGGGNGFGIGKNGPTSDYDALQVQFQRTLSQGLQALASYTYSHSIDEASQNFSLVDLLERASSDFDIRHNFQAAVTYDVPGEYSNPVLKSLLKHWAFDMRVTARSALPVDVYGNYDIDPATNLSVYLHPNLVPGQPLYLYGSQYPGGKIINYNAFNIPASGPGFDSEGDTPRNYARGFGAWQMNFAVRREFPIHEGLRLQFRAEAFNLFNHPAFSGINRYLTSGPIVPGCFGCGFGEASGTLNTTIGGLNPLYETGGPRSIQLALKLMF